MALWPEHIVAEVGLRVIVGVILTVIVEVIGLLIQPTEEVPVTV